MKVLFTSKMLIGSLLLIALLCLCLAATAEIVSGQCGNDVSYELDTSTGSLTISGNGDMYSDMYGDLNGFSFSSLIIKNGVTSIGGSAFYGCTGLTSITIPNSVTSIGDWAFYGCSGLTSITFPNSVSSIGEGAFYGCSGLTSVTIPKSITRIGYDVFSNCGDLSIYVTFTDSFMDWDPFAACTHLYVTIKEGMTSIPDYAFRGCTKLVRITIPNSVTSIGDSAFSGCIGLTNIKIPNSVTSIGNATFSGCAGLTSITIPSSVTRIGNSAFSGCTGLTNVTLPQKVTSIKDNAFEGCTGLTSITIPKSVTSIGDETFSDCTSLTSITIPKSVTSIGKKAFYGCTGLTNVSLLTIAKDIQFHSVFSECTNIEKMSISTSNRSYSSIDGIVFNKTGTAIIYCPPAKSGKYTIPTKVTAIENYAFENCKYLRSIVIPTNVTSIGMGAFYHCSSLTSINLPNGLYHISANTFEGCTKLKSISIPKTVTSIDNNAFLECTRLTSVTIPKTVRFFGGNIFDKKTRIIAIKGSYAAQWAYENYYKLKTVIDISDAKITIEDQVFTGKALKPTVTVKLGKKTLLLNKAYTVSYKDNKKIGAATVIITGKGQYGETAEATFRINPKPVKITSLTISKNKVVVKWGKGSGITGYELQWNPRNNFKQPWEWSDFEKSKSNVTINSDDLKAEGKKWYFRIRTYKTIGWERYYSDWSEVKAIKLK